MLNSNFNEKILGRWINNEIEYVFSQNKTFQIIEPKSDKVLCGYFNILDNKINYTLSDYSRSWIDLINYVDHTELKIKHISNKITKNLTLKKAVDNYQLKRFKALGDISLTLALCFNHSFYPMLLMNDDLKKSLDFNHFVKPEKPEFKKEKPEKTNGFLYYILILVIGVLVFVYIKKQFGVLTIMLSILLMYTDPIKKDYIYKYEGYQKEKRNFDNQFQKYINETSLNDEDYQMLKNKENIVTLLKKAKYTVGNDYIKGKSHDFFLKKLILYFGSKINRSKGILESVTKLNDDFKYNNNSLFRPYISDFAYVNDEIGLVILIEIDEPYTIQNREPIHLNDNDRNSFFLQLNWIIIRLSEEQILSSSNECCEFISEIILKFEKPSKKFNLYNPVPIIAQWNQFDIYRLINCNYRENYLNNSKNKF